MSREYNRTTMTARRAPITQMWSDYVIGKTKDNVIELRRGA